jgi:hypothetical protein
MRLSTLLSVLLLLGSFAAHAGDTADTRAAREAAAERYLATIDYKTLFAGMVGASSSTLTDEQRAQVDELVKHVRIDYLQGVQGAAMVKTFTADELNALADFYGSPAGKSAMAKLGPYMKDVMPLIMAEMKRAVDEWRAEKAARPKSSGA